MPASLCLKDPPGPLQDAEILGSCGGQDPITMTKASFRVF